MAGGMIFEYKCSKCSEKTEKRMPPSTSYNGHDSIICEKCLIERKEVVRAFLTYARPEK